MSTKEQNRINKKRTHVRFTDQDYQKVKTHAVRQGVSIPELLRSILKIYMAKKGESKK